MFDKIKKCECGGDILWSQYKDNETFNRVFVKKCNKCFLEIERKIITDWEILKNGDSDFFKHLDEINRIKISSHYTVPTTVNKLIDPIHFLKFES
jgi:hypothetical protein